MVARRGSAIEIDRVKDRRLARFDIAFLAQFPFERFKQRFAFFDAAAGQMPSRYIGVFNQKDAAFSVENQAANADREPARKSPIGVKKPPDKRLERAADAI